MVQAAHPRPFATTLAFLTSILATGRLLASHKLSLPANHVGARLRFEDGSTPFVYRETVLDAEVAEPALLVVRFRLRLIGRRPLLHTLFRIESMANTPLFAGFPGFRSKLWLGDETTGTYRGVYQWDGAEQARSYAETLCSLLRLVSVHGSVAYHVEPDTRRDDFLRDPGAVGEAAGSDRPPRWWRLTERAERW